MRGSYFVARCLGLCLIAGSGSRASTVTMSLNSPMDTLQVNGGTPVIWVISAQVSADNQGLAMISTDLLQSMSNPAFLDMLPSPTPPAAPMAQFARPFGIGNSDCLIGNVLCPGYNGTPAGSVGARNLIQIGGAQNTLGIALGSTVGSSPAVQLGVGQSASGQIIATGVFTAPCATGVFTLSLGRVVASTIDSGTSGVILVSGADVVFSHPSITFSVNHLCAADFDCSGTLAAQDIFDFLSAWFAGDPRSDFNGDGLLDPQDIFAYLNGWFAGC